MKATTVRWIPPRATSDRDPLRSEDTTFTVQAHLWQLTGERMALVTGVFTTQGWKGRFRDTSRTRPQIAAGWHAEADGRRFTVNSVVVRPNGLYDITMERV